MACQSNCVLRQLASKKTDHNCKGAIKFNLNHWFLTDNASL